MRLIESLARMASREQSMFRAQLLREDAARLEKAQALARATPDPAAFVKRALRLGWTPGDARTAELREPLEALLGALHASEHGAGGEEAEARLEAAWRELDRVRLERLLGCLAPPPPPPRD